MKQVSKVAKTVAACSLKQMSFYWLFLSVAVCVLPSCKKDTSLQADDTLTAALRPAPPMASVTVFATGLTNPRGLKFGPDGNLYVAEGGPGGSYNSAGDCPGIQIAPPLGPFLGSPTGARVSRINSMGVRTTVTDQLPTALDAINSIFGAADVAFVGNDLYALVPGGGCSHGNPNKPSGIYKVHMNGTVEVLADLGNWELAHPAGDLPGDLEPQGAWYSMVSVNDALYALDPNQGQLVKVSTTGTITRVADLSVANGHTVPTSLAYHGNFYIGSLGTFPIAQEGTDIYKVTPSGQVKTDTRGFTTALAIVFDNKANMFVLENSVGVPFPTPGTGRIVQVYPNGTKNVIATGLSLPTGMTMGPDGNLYVSNWGFGLPPGGGQVVKVWLN